MASYSSYSSTSDASDRSKSTAPTIYSDPPPKRIKPVDTDDNPADSKDSVSTYRSTIPSFEELPEEICYDVVDRTPDSFPPEAIPSKPSNFANLFPSSRRLLIRHDDATLDGNMNLRVDTTVSKKGGHQSDVILFHLRMYDLYSRKFSFRRYCRDSGREVCHSVRKPMSSAMDKHPLFRPSWGNMLASLRPGSSGSTSAGAGLKRRDSGYKPAMDDDSIDDEPSALGSSRQVDLSDTIAFEFSNYAHVELKRRGVGASTRYGYEYWSTKYQWRRGWREEGEPRGVSYYLVNMHTSKSVAYIVPETLTPLEAVEEESKGGWIPPSSMWIGDSSMYETMPDIAEYVSLWVSECRDFRIADRSSVIVATGLTVLVDDCIRRRWHPAKSSLSRSLELMRPEKLIGGILHRRGSA